VYKRQARIVNDNHREKEAKNLAFRDPAPKANVNGTCLPKIENHKLDFGDYAGEGLLRKLVKVLGGAEDDLPPVAEAIPADIKKRFVRRPDAFRKIARLDDDTLDPVLAEIKRLRPGGQKRAKAN
jgi:hypothetical protein